MKKLIAIASIVLLTAFKPVSETVYVCVSKGSVAYHSNRDCSGLAHCKFAIKAMSVSDAVKLGKRECHICYKRN
jgi:hypothetical protein